MKYNALALVSCLFAIHYTQACEPVTIPYSAARMHAVVKFAVIKSTITHIVQHDITCPLNDFPKDGNLHTIIENDPYYADVTIVSSMPPRIILVHYKVTRQKPPFINPIVLTDTTCAITNFFFREYTFDIPTQNSTILESDEEVAISFQEYIEEIP